MAFLQIPPPIPIPSFSDRADGASADLEGYSRLHYQQMTHQFFPLSFVIQVGQ